MFQGLLMLITPKITLGIMLICAVFVLNACIAQDTRRAEHECYEKARNAQSPTGKIDLGVGNKAGFISRLDLTISSDFLSGADPNDVYNSCMWQKTGQAPKRPFSSLSHRRG